MTGDADDLVAAVRRADAALAFLLDDDHAAFAAGAGDVVDALAAYLDSGDEGPLQAVMASASGRPDSYRAGGVAVGKLVLAVIAELRAGGD